MTGKEIPDSVTEKNKELLDLIAHKDKEITSLKIQVDKYKERSTNSRESFFAEFSCDVEAIIRKFRILQIIPSVTTEDGSFIRIYCWRCLILHDDVSPLDSDGIKKFRKAASRAIPIYSQDQVFSHTKYIRCGLNWINR